jgi:hypothetical protein
VLTFDGSIVVLQARSGADRTLLWSLDSPTTDGALAYPVGRDLTGDGQADLLFVAE